MINYIEKGGDLHNAVNAAGYFFIGNSNKEACDSNGNQSVEIDAIVQKIIDNYSQLDFEKAEAIKNINTAAGKVRAKYATDIAFQTEAYKDKQADAEAFKAVGYPENDLVNYPYMHARATRLGTTGQVAADFIISIATGWKGLLRSTENKRDAANEQIAALKDWSKCEPTAKAIIEEFEAM